MTRLSHEEMVHEMEKAAYGNATWLENFSSGRNKRPDQEIADRQRQLQAHRQAISDYQSAAQRKREAA